ncbi:ribonuclease H-like domain-containing protein [Tanacetum coccineum]
MGESKPQGSGMLNSALLWLSMALNDIVITSNDEYGIKEFKEFLTTKFLIKDFGVLKYFLGIEILENENGLCMSQRKYCLEYGLLAARLVDIPSLENCVLSFEEYKKNKYRNDFTSYQKLVGKGSPGCGIHFNKSFDLKLRSFVDADLAKCPKTKKSVTAVKTSSWSKKTTFSLFCSSPDGSSISSPLATKISSISLHEAACLWGRQEVCNLIGNTSLREKAKAFS